jgi:hypothetical protein
VAKVRRQWINAAGKAISWSAVGVAVASGLGALAAGAGWLGSPEDTPALRWSVTGVLAALAVVAVAVAAYPTWSVTVGRRGIGVRKLGRTRFVDYDGLVDVDLEPRRIRIATRRGRITVYPRLQDADGFADHVQNLRREADGLRDGD